MKTKISGLQLIINTDSLFLFSFIELATQALLGGVDSIQFRHKGLYNREFYSIASQLSDLCSLFSIPLIVNDRVDIALAIQAAGVHLGQTDLPIKTARQLLGDEKIIGITASTLEEAKQAEMDGADYIGFGHIYPTKTKIKHNPPVGLGTLKQVCELLKIPVLAIGGINLQNLASVCETNTTGVAVVSAITASSDPLNQTKKFKEIINAYQS